MFIPNKQTIDVMNFLEQDYIFLDAIINHVSDPIFVKDADFKFVILNEALCQLMACPKETLIGKGDYDFFSKEEADVFREKDAHLLATGVTSTNEEKITNTANQTRIISTKKSLYVAPSGAKYIVGIIRDITEIKTLQQQLSEVNKTLEEKVKTRTAELEQRNKELEEFAYISSHDMQEPLRTLMSSTARLEKECEDKLTGNAARYMQFIAESARRMSTIVQSVLTYSLLGKERIITNVDCNKVVSHIEQNLMQLIAETGTQLLITPLPTITSNYPEIRTLFQNLITNAIKFRRDEVPPVIKIKAHLANNFWVFSVADNGIGIDSYDTGKIFELFKRLHIREEFEGTGIGLSYCKKIINLNGGEIWVDSIPQEGSTFYFKLPKLNANEN